VVFWGRNGDNESVLAAAAAHPDLFIPFVSVSPERRAWRTLWAADDKALLERLDALLRSGRFKGIGEISVAHFPSLGFPEADFDPAGPTMRGIMALARRHGVPVLVHCEVTRLSQFSALLADFEDVATIWAHGGYTPLFLAERMLERHPNLTYELSARTWRRHPRSPEYTIMRDDEAVWPEWLALVEAMPGRFLVGTDASHHDLGRERMKLESVQRFLDQLSPAARQAVAEGNIRRLLKLTDE
jgi:predicted TIM-barrel fold metal-dependent hydrolase